MVRLIPVLRFGEWDPNRNKLEVCFYEWCGWLDVMRIKAVLELREWAWVEDGGPVGAVIRPLILVYDSDNPYYDVVDEIARDMLAKWFDLFVARDEVEVTVEHPSKVFKRLEEGPVTVYECVLNVKAKTMSCRELRRVWRVVDADEVEEYPMPSSAGSTFWA